MKIVIALSLLGLVSCASQAPSGNVATFPFVYKEFGFAPKNWTGGPLTTEQQSELEACKTLAKEAADSASMLSRIYGRTMSAEDMYAPTLVSCLTDAKNGKGWSVMKNNG